MERPRFEPRRELGRTGFRATVLGIGDLADRSVPLETCVATLRRALDAGLNLVDTAPAYENGYSEEIVGAALAGRRDGVFVIDKIDDLRDPVAPQIEASLARLHMPMVDLFAFHNVSAMDDWEAIAAPGGGMEQLAEHVRAGRVRFRGISSHHPDVLRAAIESGLCDVVMLPIGPFVDERYVSETLPLARARGVGTVAFKTFGAGKLVDDTSGYNEPLPGAVPGKPKLPRLTPEECVRYTLTIDPDVALLGLSRPLEQDAAFTAASAFRPLSAAELADVRARAAKAIEGKGRCWWNPKP